MKGAAWVLVVAAVLLNGQVEAVYTDLPLVKAFRQHTGPGGNAAGWHYVWYDEQTLLDFKNGEDSLYVQSLPYYEVDTLRLRGPYVVLLFDGSGMNSDSLDITVTGQAFNTPSAPGPQYTCELLRTYRHHISNQWVVRPFYTWDSWSSPHIGPIGSSGSQLRNDRFGEEYIVLYVGKEGLYLSETNDYAWTSVSMVSIKGDITLPECGDVAHPYPVGDVNLDCHVDLADVGRIVSRWLATGCVSPDWCFGCDLDENGTVDVLDLAVVAQYWLVCTAPECD